MHRSTPLTSISVTVRRVALLAALVLLVACGDSPTAPQYMDPEAVARVMPSVLDARVRVSAGLVDASLRQRMRLEIQMLESALTENNVYQARVCVNKIGDALTSYRGSSGGLSEDASDLAAIDFMLFAVAPVVRNTRYDSEFRASP